MFDYDVGVIGAGSAGLVACKVAAGLGKKTVLIERRKIGGDCTWFGCIPSKALIKAANIASDARRLKEFGLTSEEPLSIDGSNVMDHVRAIVQADADKHPPSAYQDEGIDVVFGAAKFIDKHMIDLGDRTIRCKKFIICTGSHPFIPPIEGIDKVLYLTNETIFDLEKLPKSMIILGGGPIGSEMCCAMTRLGVDVTVVEKARHILVREESEISLSLMKCLSDEGVKFLNKNEIVSLHQEHGKIFAKLQDFNGHKTEIHADALLVAVGRRASIKDLGLVKAEVEFNAKGIKVDKHMQTTAKNIYAAGDVVPPYLFTHIAEYEAMIAATNACLPLPIKKANYEDVLWCTFTSPQLARVGLTEEQARQKYGDKVMVYRWQNRKIDCAKTDLATKGLSKIVCDNKGRILGAHILGAEAAEILHEIQLARTAGIKFHKIASVIHAYPSYSDSIRQPAKKCYVDLLQKNIIIKSIQAIKARHNRKRIILLLAALIVFLILWFSGIRDTISLDNIQMKGEELKLFIGNNYIISIIAFIALYIVITAFSIPVAAALTITSGYLYSFVIGALYVNVGATIGAALAFLFARYIAGEPLQQKYKRKLKKFNKELDKNGANYLFTIRLIFVFPFFIVNLLAGLTKVKLRTFIWTTSLGILPSSLIYAFAGEQIGKIHHVREIFSGPVLIAFIMLAAAAISPTIYKKIKVRNNRNNKPKILPGD